MENKVSLRVLQNADVTFTDVFVPEENRLSKADGFSKGTGHRKALAAFLYFSAAVLGSRMITFDVLSSCCFNAPRLAPLGLLDSNWFRYGRLRRDTAIRERAKTIRRSDLLVSTRSREARSDTFERLCDVSHGVADEPVRSIYFRNLYRRKSNQTLFLYSPEFACRLLEEGRATMPMVSDIRYSQSAPSSNVHYENKFLICGCPGDDGEGIHNAGRKRMRRAVSRIGKSSVTLLPRCAIVRM